MFLPKAAMRSRRCSRWPRPSRFVYPHMTGIGGDAFWLVRHPDGQVHYIEACGYAGSGATIAHYREQEWIAFRREVRSPPSRFGRGCGWHLAMDLAKALGGRLPLRVLLEFAIAQARRGYAVSPCEARTQPKELDALREAPDFAKLLH